MTGINYPMRVVHEIIASSLEIIIQVSRLKDGTRPIFIPRLEANGFVVSPDFFGTDLA
jgi:Flp pilus assembly CpaF family ATPase